MERLNARAADTARSILGTDFIPIGPDACRNAGWPGSYALLIKVDEVYPIHFGKQMEWLSVGWYAYCGSAKGPGGVGARIARHLSANKKPHWHVDALTMLAAQIDALAAADISECDIAARLCGSGFFAHILPGFGSSDCRTCASHLLAWQD